MTLVPALLPMNEREFDTKLALLLTSPQVTRVQIDVVDGKVAIPASWPYTAPDGLARRRNEGLMLPHAEKIEYEIDLMTQSAMKDADAWLALGASRLTFHVESLASDPHLLQKVHQQYGSGIVSIGLAINVSTDTAVVAPHVSCISYLQCMGIARIGRQGEAFDARALDQVRKLRAAYPELPVQVDGGVNLTSARDILAAGATTLVVGSAILAAPDPLAAIAEFERLGTPYGV